MTVRDWLASRASVAPSALLSRMVELLGDDVNAPAERATSVFVETARSTLGELLEAKRFDRDGALDLLAVDALMTYAYEHAAETSETVEQLEAVALDGAASISHLCLSS